MYRGKKDRKRVKAKKDAAKKEAKEENDAATKIQANYRGKMARRQVQEKKE